MSTTKQSGAPAGEMGNAIVGFLGSIPLFAQIAPTEAMDVLRLLRKVHLFDGEVLFRHGDAPGGMWILGEGCEVTVELANPAGKGVRVATLHGGQTVGEMALVDDSPRSATAIAVRGGLAYQIDSGDFQVMRERFHPAAFKMLRWLATDGARRLRLLSSRIAPSAGQDLVATAGDLFSDGAKIAPEDFKALPHFEGMPATVLLALSQKFREKSFPAGTVLFRQGERGDGIYLLVEGSLELDRGGQVIAKLGAGSLLGLVSSVDGGPRSADGVAKTPVRLWRLDRDGFEWLFNAGNRFAYRIVDTVAQQMVSRLRQLNAVLLMQCSDLPFDSEPEGAAASAAGALAQAESDVELDVALDEAFSF